MNTGIEQRPGQELIASNLPSASRGRFLDRAYQLVSQFHQNERGGDFSLEGLPKGQDLARGVVALAIVGGGTVALDLTSKATAQQRYRVHIPAATRGIGLGGSPDVPPSPTATPRPTETPPVVTGPKYEFSAEVNAEVINEVKQYVTKTESLYKSLGIEPVPGITIYVSDNPDYLTDAEMRVLNLPESERDERLERWKSPYAFGGSIAENTFQTGAIFIKVSGWNERTPLFRSKMIGHEYTGVLKSLRAKMHTGSPMDSVGAGGPRWLHSGTNEEGGWELAKTLDSQGYQSFRDMVSRDIASNPYSLQSMETTRGFDASISAGRDGYSIAWLGADYLVQTSGGIDSMFRYYGLIGQGKSWDQAFTQAFGRNLPTFYAQYDAHLRANSTTATPRR